VIIGDKGLTELVIAEIDRSLTAHELIKVRAMTDDRKARDAWLPEICARLEAHAVQQIGKMFVIYRENPKERIEKKRLAPRLRGGDPAPKDAGSAKRTSRPQSRTPSPRPESAPRRRRPTTSR
jgi:RNA-binding protein